MSEGTPEKARRGIEDASKEELLTMLQRLKAHAQQATSEKQAVEEQLAQSIKQNEETKEKALTLLKRCRDLEASKAATVSDSSNSEQQLAKEQETNALLLAKIKTLNDTIESTQLQSEGLTEAFHAKVVEVSTKADEYNALKKQFDEFKETMTTKLTTAVEKLKEFKEVINSKSMEVETQQMRIAALEKQLSTSTTSSSTSTSANDTSITTDATKAIEELKEKHKVKMDTAVEKLKEFKETIDTLRIDLSSKNTLVEELKAALDAATHDAAKYKGAMDNALPKFKELKEELKAKESECKEWQQRVVALESTAELRSTTDTATADEVKITQDKFLQVQAQLQKQAQEHQAELEKSEAAFKAEISSLVKTNERAIEANQQELHKALSELETVQQGLQSKEAAFDQLREQLLASEGNLQTLKTARDTLQDQLVRMDSELNQLKESTLKQSVMEEDANAAKLALMTTERDELQQQLYEIVEQLNRPLQLFPSDTKNGMNDNANEAMIGDETVGSPIRQGKRSNNDDIESSPASSTNSSSEHLISLVEFQDIYDSPGCKSPVETYASNPLRLGGKPVPKPAAAMRQLSYGAAQRVAELQAKVATQTKMLKKQQDEMHALNEHLASLQSQLTAASAGSNELVQQLQGRVSELQADTDSKHNEVAQLNEQIATLQSQLTAVSSQGDARVQQLQTQLTALENESAAAAAEHSKAQEQSKELSGKAMEKLKELKEQLQEKSQVVIDLNSQISSLQTASKEQAAQLAQAVKAKDDDVERLNGQIASLQSQLTAASAGSDELVQQLQVRVSELQADIENKHEEAISLNKQLVSLENQLKTQLESLQSAHTDALNTTKAEEKAKMEKIQRDLDDRITTHITQFEQQSLELRSQINTLETELAAIRMDHTKAKEQEVMLLESIDTLNRQLAEQMAEQSAVATNTKNAQELLEESARQEEERKASLVQASAQVDILNHQLADSQQQMKNMEQQCAQKDEEMKLLQTEMDTLRSTHQEQIAEHTKVQDKSKEMMNKMMDKLKKINSQLEERTQELALARSASTDLSSQQLEEQTLREEQRKELENQLTLLEKQLTVVRADLLQSEATAATQARELTKTHENALQTMNERFQQEQTINQQLLLKMEESKASFEQVTAQAASSEQVAAQLQSDLQDLHQRYIDLRERETTAADSVAQQMEKTSHEKQQLQQTVEESRRALEEAQQTIEGFTAQCISYADHVARLEQQLVQEKKTGSELEQVQGTVAELSRRHKILLAAWTYHRQHQRQSTGGSSSSVSNSSVSGSDLDIRTVHQRSVYEGVTWCLIRRAKSAMERAADSLLVMDEKGAEGGAKGGIEWNDEIMENGVVCVDEWRLESEVLAWIDRRGNDSSSTTSESTSQVTGSQMKRKKDLANTPKVVAKEDSPPAPLVTLPSTIQDTYERSMDQLRETLGGQIDGLKAEKEQQQLAFDKYRERSRQGMMKMSEELKDYEGKLSQVTKTLQTEQHRVVVAENMLMEKRTEWDNQHREAEKEHQRLVEQVKEMTDLIESLEQEKKDLRMRLHEHETQLRLGKAGENEVNILREQMDVLTEDVTRLGLREKQLMAEMKKKGDLARQMLVEKDKLIHSLQHGQGGLGGGGGGGGGGAMSATPSSLSPSTPSNDNKDKQKENEKEKGGSVVTALPPSPMTPFTPMNNITSATHAPVSVMSHLSSPHATAAAACISPASASSASPPASSPQPDISQDPPTTPISKPSHLSVHTPMTNEMHDIPLTPTLPSSRTNLALVRSPSNNSVLQSGTEQEQYLKQAFCAFVRAKEAVEMNHLGRVICAILRLTVEEQQTVMEHIGVLSTAAVATSALSTFSTNFSSLFA